MATPQDKLPDLSAFADPPAPPKKPRAMKAAPVADGLPNLDAFADPVSAKSRAASAPAPSFSPHVQSKIDAVITDLRGRGVDVRLDGGSLRTPEQQAEKVRLGYSKTYNSKHLTGRAADLVVYENGRPQWDNPKHPHWSVIGEVAKAHGASRWGGDFSSFYDPAHVEFDDDAREALPGLSELAEPDDLPDLSQFADSSGDEEVERVDSIPASHAVAPSSSSVPTRESLNLNPYSPEDRERRDAAASSRGRAVTLPLTRSLADYENSRSLMADAYRAGARALNISPAFVEAWIKTHPQDMRLIGDPSQPDATPADLLGSSAHDERRGTVRLELGGLADLERDYHAQRSTPQRIVDFATDDTTTAGEKFLDVAAPVASAVGRAGDLATRPLSATSDGLWSLARKHSPTEAVSDAWHKFRTGGTNKGAGNWIAEQARNSETLRRLNPNLPAMVGGVAEMLTDPANAIPLGMLAKGAGLVRGFKGVRLVEEALLASRDARALEFFNNGGKILKLEARGERGFVVALRDSGGVVHDIDLSALYANGKPKLKSVPADQELSGVGLEREGASGRVYQDGRPQDFRMESDGSLVAAPVGGKAGRAAVTPKDEVDALVAALADDPALTELIPVNSGVPTRTGLRARLSAALSSSSVPSRPSAATASSSGVPTRASLVRRGARTVADVINISKSIPASFDLSALGSQGGIIAGARPSLIPGAVSDAARATLSKEAFETFKKKLVMSPNHPLRESSGLDLTSLKGGEEQFASRFTKSIPGVAASERNFNATVDAFRASAFDLYADQLTKAGVTDPKAFKDIARWVNVATGRGEMGRLEPLADVLNLPMFSPRLLASKFNILSPVRYARMHPAARKVALTEMFRATGSLAVTMGLAKLAGADVDLDPFSGGFGTISASGTSYDLSGGRLRPLRFAFQIADSLNRERRGETVKDARKPGVLVEKFFRAYLSPAGAPAVDAYTGTDFNGKEFGSKEWKPGELKFGELDRLMPFALKDIRDAYHAAGTVGAVKALPSVVGVGVRTRDKSGDAIKPTLGDGVNAELDRLKLDLDHLGKKRDQSVSVKPGYRMEGITGDAVQPFGDEDSNSVLEMDLEATAAELSAELEAALDATIGSPGYAEFASDEARRKFLELIILNTHKRVMESVRLGGRERQMQEEKKVKERLDRMSGVPSRSGVPTRMHFKL